MSGWKEDTYPGDVMGKYATKNQALFLHMF